MSNRLYYYHVQPNFDLLKDFDILNNILILIPRNYLICTITLFNQTHFSKPIKKNNTIHNKLSIAKYMDFFVDNVQFFLSN